MSTSLPSAKHRASRRGVTRTTARVAATMKPDSNVQRLKRWAPASSLLVILHYLLKNNTTFMGGWSMQSMSPISHRGTSVQDAQGGGLPDGGSI